jgi:hypothetical protein
LAFKDETGGTCSAWREESGAQVKELEGIVFFAGANACTNHGKIIAGTNKPKQQLNTNRSIRFIPAN